MRNGPKALLISEVRSPNMETNVDDLYATALAIRDAATRGIDRGAMSKRYSTFATQYPRLFEACCNVDFSLSHLTPMLHALKGMRSGKLAADDANRQVFESLRAEYLVGLEDDEVTHERKVQEH
jgi:hypothetical protein